MFDMPDTTRDTVSLSHGVFAFILWGANFTFSYD